MKAIELKKFIKQAVKEAIQEELKDILLEAVRSPKTIVKESYSSPSVPQVNSAFKPVDISTDKRQAYMDILGETALSFTSQDVQRFNPAGVDPVNGSLPSGDVGMDQIMNLMNPK
jgi:hypothetical protein